MKRALVPAAIIAEIQENAERQDAKDFIVKEMDRIRQVLREKTQPREPEAQPVEPQPVEIPHPYTLAEIGMKDEVLLSNLLYLDSYLQRFYLRYMQIAREKDEEE